MVSDDTAASLPFLGVVMQVGAACCLGPVLVTLAVVASGLAADHAAAST
jgi:hypothetical protein